MKQIKARFPFPQITETLLRNKISQGVPIYQNFINKAKFRAEKEKKKNPTVYLETHHIIPIHAGGSDSSENLVQLTFNDHIIAHYLRWIVENDPKDKTAYLIMSGQTENTRLEIARLGGTLGGPKTQVILKEQQKGWYNSDEQAKRGRKAAEINRLNQKGAWSAENLEILAKGRETMKKNSEVYLPQKSKNLQKGRETLASGTKN